MSFDFVSDMFGVHLKLNDPDNVEELKDAVWILDCTILHTTLRTKTLENYIYIYIYAHCTL